MVGFREYDELRGRLRTTEFIERQSTSTTRKGIGFLPLTRACPSRRVATFIQSQEGRVGPLPRSGKVRPSPSGQNTRPFLLLMHVGALRCPFRRRPPLPNRKNAKRDGTHF